MLLEGSPGSTTSTSGGQRRGFKQRVVLSAHAHVEATPGWILRHPPLPVDERDATSGTMTPRYLKRASGPIWWMWALGESANIISFRFHKGGHELCSELSCRARGMVPLSKVVLVPPLVGLDRSREGGTSGYPPLIYRLSPCDLQL